MSFPLSGNSRIKDSIEVMVQSERLPHAVIIEGDWGTGKRTLSRYLAKIAVCDEKNPPCNVCRNCHLADTSTHPDIEVVSPEDKKKNIAVEQIRNLRTTAYHSAHTAKRRAFIIEQADTMNASSQNSLLKVLEEPPSDVIFILLVTSAEKLLETVVSRCVTLSLYPPSIEEGANLLTAHHDIKRDEALIILEDEKCNIGRALMRINGTLDSLGKTCAKDFLDNIENNSILSALLCVTALEKNRPEATKFARELGEILIENIKKLSDLPETAREYTKMYTALCELVPTLETNINLGLFFSALACKFAAIKNK